MFDVVKLLSAIEKKISNNNIKVCSSYSIQKGILILLSRLNRHLNQLLPQQSWITLRAKTIIAVLTITILFACLTRVDSFLSI